MSRCFPFPPPGYEKKITNDDTGLLKELEKRKDKRHKKDKEKRDRDRDKDREKSRSRDKSKEKKERKEKRKDKDRNRRDKQQEKISNEKRIEEQGCSSVENFGSSKSFQSNGIGDCKYVQELARRIGDADSAGGSQMVQKIDAAKKRKAEQLAAPAENTNGNHAEKKGKPKDKMGDGRRLNGCRDHFEARCLENANGDNFFGMAQKRFDGISTFMENSLAQSLDGKDKKKIKESVNSDIQKDQEKTRIPMDENWDKEKKKEDKVKEINEQSDGHLRLKENSVRSKEGSSYVGVVDVGKCKDLELNGFLHGNGIRSNKLRKPTPPHSVVKNGKKLEPCQTAFELASEQGQVCSQRVDLKEHGINCVVKDQGPNVCSMSSSSAVQAVHSNGDTSAKPPHRDSKYLSQILTVPKVEWSDLNDQEWLFSGDNLMSKKPEVACNLVDRTPQVWADALKIDYADVTALPYVVPY